MSDSTLQILDTYLDRKSLKKLSENTEYAMHPNSIQFLTNCERRCYDFDKINKKEHTVDALDYINDEYYLIEFKDQKVYSFDKNKKETAEILFKTFESINEVLGLFKKSKVSKSLFYDKKINIVYVFSTVKSTQINDLNTFKQSLHEKYGNIFKVDVVNSVMFEHSYIQNNKIGIS